MEIATLPNTPAPPYLPEPIADWCKLVMVQSTAETTAQLARVCREQTEQDSVAGAIAALNLATTDLDQAHALYETAGPGHNPPAGTPEARADLAMAAIAALDEAGGHLTAMRLETQECVDLQAGSYSESEIRRMEQRASWHENCYRCLCYQTAMQWHIDQRQAAMREDNATLAEAHALNMDNLACAAWHALDILEPPPGNAAGPAHDQQQRLLSQATQAAEDCRRLYLEARFGHRRALPAATDAEVRQFLNKSAPADAEHIASEIRHAYAGHQGHIMAQTVSVDGECFMELITVEHKGAMHTFAGGNPFPKGYPAQTVINEFSQYPGVNCPCQDEECEFCFPPDTYDPDAAPDTHLTLRAYIQAAAAGIHDCPAATLQAVFRQSDLAIGGDRYARRLLLAAISNGHQELMDHITGIVWPEREPNLLNAFTRRDARKILDFAQNELKLSRHAVHTLAVAIEADADYRYRPPKGKPKPRQQALKLLRKAGASEATLANVAAALGQPSISMRYEAAVAKAQNDER